MHDYISVQNKINAKSQEIQNVKNDPDEIAELNNEIKELESEKNKHKPDFDKLTKEKNDTQKQLMIAEQKQAENEKLLKSLAEKEDKLNAKNQAYNSQPDRMTEIAEKQKVSEENNNMKVRKLLEVENGSEQFNLLSNTSINKSKFIADFVSKSILFTKECFKPINKNDPLPNYITPTSLNLFLQNELNDGFMVERIKDRTSAYADLLKNIQKHDLYNIERLLIKTYLSLDVKEKQQFKETFNQFITPAAFDRYLNKIDKEMLKIDDLQKSLFTEQVLSDISLIKNRKNEIEQEISESNTKLKQSSYNKHHQAWLELKKQIDLEEKKEVKDTQKIAELTQKKTIEAKARNESQVEKTKLENELTQLQNKLKKLDTEISFLDRAVDIDGQFKASKRGWLEKKDQIVKDLKSDPAFKEYIENRDSVKAVNTTELSSRKDSTNSVTQEIISNRSTVLDPSQTSRKNSNDSQSQNSSARSSPEDTTLQVNKALSKWQKFTSPSGNRSLETGFARKQTNPPSPLGMNNEVSTNEVNGSEPNNKVIREEIEKEDVDIKVFDSTLPSPLRTSTTSLNSDSNSSNTNNVELTEISPIDVFGPSSSTHNNTDLHKSGWDNKSSQKWQKFNGEPQLQTSQNITPPSSPKQSVPQTENKPSLESESPSPSNSFRR